METLKRLTIYIAERLWMILFLKYEVMAALLPSTATFRRVALLYNLHVATPIFYGSSANQIFNILLIPGGKV